MVTFSSEPSMAIESGGRRCAASPLGRTKRLGELDGRSGLVTGGAAGIGRAIALELARGGTAVIINARQSAREADAGSKAGAGCKAGGAAARLHEAHEVREVHVHAV